MELDVRYGHAEGHTEVCYSSDGEKILSGGADGEIRIWNGTEDCDPQQACIAESILCVQQIGSQIYVGSENNNVQQLIYPTAKRDGILTRFMAHVNHLAISQNWIAMGSEDMTIKVMETKTKDTKQFAVDGPVLGVALCPKAEFLAVSSGDGMLRIFSLDNEMPLIELSVVPKANSFHNTKTYCRMSFDCTNKYIAYPSKNCVMVLEKNSWEEAFTYNSDDVKAAFSIVSFSPCGMYIAAASVEGDLAIWNVHQSQLVKQKKHPSNVGFTSMSWNPKNNGELILGDVQGCITVVKDCLGNSLLPNGNISSAAAPATAAPIPESNSVDAGMDFDDDADVDFGDVQIEDDDDDDNENAVSLEKLKRETMGLLDDDDNVKDDDASSRSSPPPRARSRTPEIPLQAAFMPSSTPEHLDPRYLCWNGVGIVRSYGANLEEDDEGSKSIEVEFHDFSFHNSMMVNNFQMYSMGSLSTGALAVANENEIHVIPLGVTGKDWQMKVPEIEDIVAIAASQYLVCFATSNYSVHVCTIFGTQKSLLAIPGPVLCMAAFGHVLLIAYHAASTRKGDQCLELMLVKLEGITVDSRNINCALSPGGKLQWLGFSDVGTPSLMDSKGVLFMYPLLSNLWMPMYDTAKLTTVDTIFVTEVHESSGKLRGIRCKGTIYPSFTPRPTITQLDLQPPFIDCDSEKGQLEANMALWSTLRVRDTERQMKESALKYFALAVRNGNDHRAFEWVEMLGNLQTVLLSTKYATKLDRKRLVEKLTSLAQKLENEDDGEEEIKEVPVTPVNVIKPNAELLKKSLGKIMNRNKVQTPTSTPATISEDLTPKTLKSLNSTVTTQEMQMLQEEPKNPFLKSMKKPKAEKYNPLSLTNKFAGVEEQQKENEANEKRKKPDNESPVEKSKQMKLSQFAFTKRQ